MAKIVAEKVTEYERFLNETLRGDLKQVLGQRDVIYKEISEYLQLKTMIEQVQKIPTGERLKMKVDLGCNFYVQAKVDDPSMIYVSVGFGFFVEMTHDEALNFIEKKTKQLTEQSEMLTRNATKIKAHIKLVLEGLKELQGITDKCEKKPFRDVLQ